MKTRLSRAVVAASFLFVLLCGVLVKAADVEQTQWPWSRYGIPQTDNPCATPTPYPEKDWRVKAYEETIKIDFSGWGKNIVFLGDSITHGWNWLPGYPDGNGAKVMKEYSEKYPGVRPYSLGVSSDEPQNTLWLITEGDILKTFKAPKVIVLMIGINSLNKKKTPEQVGGGIKTIITYLRKIRPDAKILLLGILPCWDAKAPVREQIKNTNQLVRSFADNKDVFYLEFGEKVLKPDGNMNPELSYDAIHLTCKGYEVWAETMFPYLDDLVKTGGTGAVWQKSK